MKFSLITILATTSAIQLADIDPEAQAIIDSSVNSVLNLQPVRSPIDYYYDHNTVEH